MVVEKLDLRPNPNDADRIDDVELIIDYRCANYWLEVAFSLAKFGGTLTSGSGRSQVIRWPAAHDPI